MTAESVTNDMITLIEYEEPRQDETVVKTQYHIFS